MKTTPLKNECGETVPNAKDKAGLLGGVFQKIYNRNHFDEDSSVLNDIAYLPRMSSTPWFHRDKIIGVLKAEIFVIISGHIPLSFIKKVALYVAYPQEHIFNLSYNGVEESTRWNYVCFYDSHPQEGPTK